jgi:predicted Ser/Thr protein kinase
MAELAPIQLRVDAKAACVKDKIIGTGKFGVVFELNEAYVVKLQFLKTPETNNQVVYEKHILMKVDLDYFHNEVKIFKRMEGLHVTPELIDAWVEKDRCFMVIERMDGTLFDVFNGLTKEQIEVAIEQIHRIDHFFLHKRISLIDFHLKNILYTLRGGVLNIRVGDVGEVKHFDEEYNQMKSKQTTLYEQFLLTSETFDKQFLLKQTKQHQQFLSRRSEMVNTVIELLEKQKELPPSARQLRLKNRVYKKGN